MTERSDRDREIRRYETILGSLDDAVYAVRPDGTIAYVNERYAEMKGVSREELLGTDIYDWVTEETAEKATRVRREMEAGDRDAGAVEYEFLTADGERFPVEMRFNRVTSEEGDELDRVGVIRDVRERKEREETLREKNERLEEFTEHLPKLARESTDVDATVECALAAAAEDAWSVVEPDPLELVIEGDMTLRADPPRLRQVLENLFGNAADHAATGDPAATTVWVGTLDDGFYVADDGPGVAPEQAAEIFEYGMSTGDGSGVGLAIVRNIVEAHGWTISVCDREGGGAKFVVETTGTYAAPLAAEPSDA